MLKNLNYQCFSGMIRPNELIELALTHQFDTIDLNMSDMLDRARAMGKKFACQFMNSASTIAAGCFNLPIDLAAPDATFAESLKQLESVAELASAVSATRGRVAVAGAGDRVYHENFERYRSRLADLAERLPDLSIGLMLAPASTPAEQDAYQFVQNPDELLTLVKMIGRPNVGVVLDTASWSATAHPLDTVQKLKPQQVVDVLLSQPLPEGGPGCPRQLPSTDDDSVCIQVLKMLAAIDYAGTVTVVASPGSFGSNRPNDVAGRISDIYQQLAEKAGIATAGSPAV